jgi:transposase
VAAGDEGNNGSRAGATALAERDAKVAELTASNAELTAKVEALTKQVELLTELLNRNSRNSHLPPSSDGPGSSLRGGKAERNKRKAERKRGAQ